MMMNGVRVTLGVTGQKCARGEAMPDESSAAKHIPEAAMDADEVGLKTRLLTSVPLLRMLIQAVAESEGDWNYVNTRLDSGPWIGVARRWWEDFVAVSTNHGDTTPEPYPANVHDALVGHGFEFVPEHHGYRQFVRFDTDAAFTEIALLIIGTFQHPWLASLRDPFSVDLNLSLPPTEAELRERDAGGDA
jgi:hypothetical protein